MSSTLTFDKDGEPKENGEIEINYVKSFIG